MSSASLSRLGLALLVFVASGLGLGAACNHRGGAHLEADRPRVPATPSVRIYYLVDLDGYLEPCGCNARPLGGIDRLAGLMQHERAHAPDAILLAAGDLYFRDPVMDPRMTFQETAKADALDGILDQLGLVAFAPGPSDYVRGADQFARLVGHGRAVPLAANVTANPVLHDVLVRDVAGTRVGIVGVSDFRATPESAPPQGAPETADPVARARDAVARARAQHAQVVVVLASIPRRAARDIAANVPGIDFVVAAREESAHPPPAERIGNAYLVTAANQGKSVGILDLYVRADGSGFVDASSATLQAQQHGLDARISDLRARLAAWDRDPTVDHAAVAQQRARLDALVQQRATLDAPVQPPARGSWFDARVATIAPELDRRRDVEQSVSGYFHAVNEHNRTEFASLAPPPVVAGQPSFVGDAACRDCHEEAFDVWIRTPHSRAYNTLAVIDKNYNLSCVGCHVTGYRQPGGAEVVQNEGRRDVQCESCHGPGSEHLHAHGAAQARATIRRDVPASWCAGQCHTPEHSEQFDYATYRPRILGPGHGFPVGSDGGGVALSMPVLQGTSTPEHGSDRVTGGDAGR